MTRAPVKGRPRPTRRELLGAAALAALWPAARSSGSPPADPHATDPHASDPHAAPDAPRMPLDPVPRPWWLERETERSRVVEVRSRRVVHGSVVDRLLLWDMLERGLRALTGRPSASAAWRSILGDSARIAIKFNSVVARLLATSEPIARTLLEQLRDAGYPSESIALVEGPAFLTGAELITRPVGRGWGETITFGPHTEALAAWWCEADAVINVPFVMTHQITRFSGALHNLSHSVIRRPGLYHAHAASPFIPQIVGQPAVAGRLKLNLVNALRIVADRGPEAEEHDVAEYGGLFLGFDPVAVDYVGLSELMLERRRRGLPPHISVPHLDDAASLGLGRAHPAEIERVQIEEAD